MCSSASMHMTSDVAVDGHMDTCTYVGPCNDGGSSWLAVELGTLIEVYGVNLTYGNNFGRY